MEHCSLSCFRSTAQQVVLLIWNKKFPTVTKRFEGLKNGTKSVLHLRVTQYIKHVMVQLGIVVFNKEENQDSWLFQKRTYSDHVFPTSVVTRMSIKSGEKQQHALPVDMRTKVKECCH